jgi:hypothetical protein
MEKDLAKAESVLRLYREVGRLAERVGRGECRAEAADSARPCDS